MRGETKRKIFNIIFLVTVFALTIYYVFSGQNLGQMVDYIHKSDIRFWILSVICVLLFIVGESAVIHYLMRKIGQNPKMTHCVLYSFLGFFFSCVTPGAAGGQPVQLYYMSKDKIPVSVGSIVLLIVTITYKMVLIVIGGIVFIFRPSEIIKCIEPVRGWCYLGMFLTTAVVLFMYFLVYQPALSRNMVAFAINLLKRLHILKNDDKIKEKANDILAQYADASIYIKSHRMVVFNAFLITVGQRVAMFMVTYFTCRSFGYTEMSMITLIMLQGMISLAADMLPLPGGMGITESLFMSMFSPVFGAMTLAVMVVSRGLSYYTELLFSAVFTVVAYLTIGRKKK